MSRRFPFTQRLRRFVASTKSAAYGEPIIKSHRLLRNDFSRRVQLLHLRKILGKWPNKKGIDICGDLHCVSTCDRGSARNDNHSSGVVFNHFQTLRRKVSARNKMRGGVGSACVNLPGIES